jgi:hypothetical protein
MATQYQNDYYVAMVMAASNYGDYQQMPHHHSHPHMPMMSHAAVSQQDPTAQYYGGVPTPMSTGSGGRYSPYHPSPLASPHTQQPPVLSTVTAPNIQQQQGKRYTHNPYASSEPSTPRDSLHSSHNSSFNTSSDSFSGAPQTSYTAQQQTYGTPVYADGVYGDSVAYPVVNNLTEQFIACVGSIVPTACSMRGRHLLVSIMRLQHLDKIETIFQEIAPHVSTVVLDPQGCHVVRTLVEFLTPDQVAIFVSYLTPAVIVELAINSQHTRRVLQTLFERHKSEALNPVVFAICTDAVRLAMTQQGCIAIMRIIEHSLPDQRQHLVQTLIPELPALTMDPYGNYVVQCILQNFEASSCSAIMCAAFAGHWVNLSCNKFASNVMEKVVRIIVGPSRSALVEELVLNTQNLQCLMQDGFGNFVLQAVIESSLDPAEYRSIVDCVRPLLHTSPYGHKIDGKLKLKRFMRNGNAMPQLPPTVDGYSSGNSAN